MVDVLTYMTGPKWQIEVSDAFQTDGQWYFGQSLVDEQGTKIAGPFFFGPYKTQQETDIIRTQRIKELIELGNVDPTTIKRIPPHGSAEC